MDVCIPVPLSYPIPKNDHMLPEDTALHAWHTVGYLVHELLSNSRIPWIMLSVSCQHIGKIF